MKHLVISTILAALLAACTPSTDSTAGSESGTASSGSDGTYTIGVMPKLTGIAFFNATEKGAKDAGKDLGVVGSRLLRVAAAPDVGDDLLH